MDITEQLLDHKGASKRCWIVAALDRILANPDLADRPPPLGKWKDATVQTAAKPTPHPVILAKVATGSYISAMMIVSIKDAKNRLTALARLVEKGRTVVVTRNGKPVFDLVPHRQTKGLHLEAVKDFKRRHKIDVVVRSVADDFDAPLPEDFLLRSRS